MLGTTLLCVVHESWPPHPCSRNQERVGVKGREPPFKGITQTLHTITVFIFYSPKIVIMWIQLAARESGKWNIYCWQPSMWLKIDYYRRKGGRADVGNKQSFLILWYIHGQSSDSPALMGSYTYGQLPFCKPTAHHTLHERRRRQGQDSKFCTHSGWTGLYRATAIFCW